MFLYDTARNSTVPFEPGKEVSIYVCGITPYDSTHLGHANTYLTYDLLIRRLEELGHTVRLVRNITDVDDSILGKARELGVDFLELAAAETARFHGDMAALNTRGVTAEPHAREWVTEMIELITTLEKGGHTYTVEGATFFISEGAYEPHSNVGSLDRLARTEHALAAECALEQAHLPQKVDRRLVHPLGHIREHILLRSRGRGNSRDDRRDHCGCNQTPHSRLAPTRPSRRHGLQPATSTRRSPGTKFSRGEPYPGVQCARLRERRVSRPAVHRTARDTVVPMPPIPRSD